MMRGFFLLLAICGAASAQSMLEAGALVSGGAIGSAAGKGVSNGINATLTRTKKTVDASAKGDASSSTSRPPTLQVSPGYPSTQVRQPERNNVPLPPAPRRAKAAKRVEPTVATSYVYLDPTPAALPPPRNVDLAAITPGMPRTDVLAQGDPSSRITMYDDGHLVEIFRYHNTTSVSGTVRLVDGEVATVQTTR